MDTPVVVRVFLTAMRARFKVDQGQSRRCDVPDLVCRRKWAEFGFTDGLRSASLMRFKCPITHAWTYHACTSILYVHTTIHITFRYLVTTGDERFGLLVSEMYCKQAAVIHYVLTCEPCRSHRASSGLLFRRNLKASDPKFFRIINNKVMQSSLLSVSQSRSLKS
jgi:hypothetical protein